MFEFNSLCIIQDGAAYQQTYIPHVDSIYWLASIKIIATSRNNFNGGLLGNLYLIHKLARGNNSQSRMLHYCKPLEQHLQVVNTLEYAQVV